MWSETLLMASAALAAFTAGAPIPNGQTEIAVVCGTLVHHRLTNDLFHIDGVWMRVAPDTQFHRWLLLGTGRKAAIILTTDPDRFEDVRSVRILTGRLIHQTAPSATPVLHILFLRDELTGSLGAVTFETDDADIARTFDAYEDVQVGLVIEISIE